MRPLAVLLVDDNPGDVELAMETLVESQAKVDVHVCGDGVAAMKFLRREGEHREATTPDLVVLDLNMPRKGGKAVLAEMKSDPELRRIPVVVLSSSAAMADVTRSYDLGANCYITKPMDLEQFERIVRVIDEFWFSVVRLPPQA